MHVFGRTGTTWIPQQELFADDGAPGLTFGHAVSVDGDTALIGARFDRFHRDAAYVFSRTGKTWAQQQKLFSDGPHGDFGILASLEGDSALIRAWDEGWGSGAAYVFTRTGGFWAEQAERLPSDGAAGDMFGLLSSSMGISR